MESDAESDTDSDEEEVESESEADEEDDDEESGAAVGDASKSSGRSTAASASVNTRHTLRTLAHISPESTDTCLTSRRRADRQQSAHTQDSQSLHGSSVSSQQMMSDVRLSSV